MEPDIDYSNPSTVTVVMAKVLRFPGVGRTLSLEDVLKLPQHARCLLPVALIDALGLKFISGVGGSAQWVGTSDEHERERAGRYFPPPW